MGSFPARNGESRVLHPPLSGARLLLGAGAGRKGHGLERRPLSLRLREARSVCLPGVRAGCAVRFVEGESIPAEAGERIVVRFSFGEEETVRGPADLAGCVRIASAAEALEYLRLFSSLSTVHLFEPQRLEVFAARPAARPAGRPVCLRASGGSWGSPSPGSPPWTAAASR